MVQILALVGAAALLAQTTLGAVGKWWLQSCLLWLVANARSLVAP